tara:strand:+ start:321 stop:509 length:189 start_codon:yes stop_codon:yes gene_type:complete
MKVGDIVRCTMHGGIYIVVRRDTFMGGDKGCSKSDYYVMRSLETGRERRGRLHSMEMISESR